MKKLISKDELQERYLLDNGLTEVTIFNTKNKKPYTFVHAAYWHPYEIKHMMRDFAMNSPLSYVRLGQKLESLGLCIEEDDYSWDLKKILIAIADNISMNAKPWKRGISNIDKTVKEIYGTREDFKKELFETYKEDLV